MAIEVDTKDCTAIGDAELEEIADLCSEGSQHHELGELSKQAEAWVLATTAREGGKLKGFSFCTLERIGGTPSVIIGVGCIRRDGRRDSVLKSIMTDQLRRAVLAFPDEDVLVGARLNTPSGYEAFRTLRGVVPSPGHRANGEERAWGRRLAKRFGIDADDYDDRAFVAKGDGSPALVLDHESQRPESIDPALVEMFSVLDVARGDVMIVHGWAMAEELEKLLP